jgi:hypothetical protein
MLPKVNEQIAYSIKHEMLEQQHDYGPNLIERLRTENPSIIRFIEGYCRNYPDNVDVIAFCAVGVYRLLEVQMEVDELNESLA